MTATSKQISFLTNLSQQAGFDTVSDAIETYGLRRVYASELTVSQASELIDWLKSGGRPVEKSAPAIETGSRVSHADRAGLLTTILSDGRCMVRFDDGALKFVPVSEIHAI